MSREERVTGIWLAAGLTIVFAIDSLFPLGVASGMLYVPLLLLCQPANGRRWLLPVAVGSTVLIVLDLVLAIGGARSPEWVYLTNRAGSTGVLWTVAVLLRRSFRLEAAHHDALERAAALAERRVLSRPAADLRRVQADPAFGRGVAVARGLHPGALRGVVLARDVPVVPGVRCTPDSRPCSRKVSSRSDDSGVVGRTTPEWLGRLFRSGW